MEINKRCISAFAKTVPFVALATKSKLFDTAFSLTSELILINYMTGQTYPAITTDLKFCKILWCEFADKRYLVAGHESGFISIYEHQDEGLVLIKSKECLQDDIVALDFLFSKAVLVAASAKGKVVFWTLSNLEKEFTLDVPLPVNISAVSCNPKVFKILCVGTSDGVVKVIDIKKLSVILTLNSKDFSEVKQLEWDNENNTKLLVMSEKGFLTAFDLSNDSTAHVGSHKSPLIGFHGKTLVSKSQLETNGVFIEIPESFECSISTRDPVVALSQTNGVTQIMSVPMYKGKAPFCLVASSIFTPDAVHRLQVQNTYEAPESDGFYEELIKLVNQPDGSNSEKLGTFILEHNSTFQPPSDNSCVDIDLSDPFTHALVKNNFEGLKNSDHQVDLSVLDIVRTCDIERLRLCTDAKVLLVLSKLLNDYSALSRLRNPRILAAILVFHDCKDLSPLEGTKEGRTVKAILSGDYGLYLDNRAPRTDTFLRSMKEYEGLVASVQPFLKKPLESKSISKFFWYQIFMGNLEKVKDLNFVDPQIQCFLLMLNEKPLENKIKNISSHQSIGRNRAVAPVADKLAGMDLSESHKSQNTYVPATDQGFRQPPYPNTPKTSFKAPSSTPIMNTNSSNLNSFSKPSSIPHNSNSFSMPSSIPHNANSFSKPSNIPHNANSFSAPSIGTLNNNFSSGSFQQGVPTTPFHTGPTSPLPKHHASTPLSPQALPKSPHQNFSTLPKSPFIGSVPMNPLKGSIPSKMPSAPSLQPLGVRNFQQPLTGTHKPPSPVLLSHPSSAPVANEPLNVENPTAVVSSFDSLVSDVRSKASLNTSIILKQRKNQFLNALNSYESLDKNNIPQSILYVMDLVTKRIDANGNNLKPDLSALVEGYSDIVWLKAFVELVKMVY